MGAPTGGDGGCLRSPVLHACLGPRATASFGQPRKNPSATPNGPPLVSSISKRRFDIRATSGGDRGRRPP